MLYPKKLQPEITTKQKIKNVTSIIFFIHIVCAKIQKSIKQILVKNFKYFVKKNYIVWYNLACMKVVTLASGSKGNCTLIQTDNVNLLIDAGISLTEIEQKLQFLNVNPKDIYGILITHEHSDHIKNAGVFARKHNCFVFSHISLWNTLQNKIGVLEKSQKMAFTSNNFYIKDITVSAFELSHDCPCFGYSFYCQGNKISIATDLGYAPQNVLDNLKDSNILILEANHDENLLLNNPKYSMILKRRILSNKGHLSNKSCGEIIAKIYSKNLKQVILAHLSEENNNPSLAYNTVKQVLSTYGLIEGEHIFVDVATQHGLGNIFELSNN